jgi:archaellum component FlaF (FlaF/FlaG flagellin family)
MKPSLKKSALKTLSVSAMFIFAFVFLGVNNVYSQSASPDEFIPNVDRDYVDQFEAQVDVEIQNVQNDTNLSNEEKTVRVKLLSAAVSNANNGLLIERAFDVAYNQIDERVQLFAPNVNLKTILLEYKNQFS